MSGRFGWHKNDQDNGSMRQPNNPFGKAAQAYHTHAPAPAPSARARVIDPAPPPARSIAAAATRAGAIPDAGGTLKSTAANVLIAILDVTGSMRQWPTEIFKRLPLLYQEACAYLDTQDLEILFIAHADADGDAYPLQVARFGRGPELDAMLAAFKVGGGGAMRDACESHELVLYKLVRDVDTSSAVNVHAFFLTDERGRDAVNEHEVRSVFGRPVEGELRTARDLARHLRRRMNLWAVLCDTKSYDPAPIRAWWEELLGIERVLPLDDARRAVDVIIAALAAHTGQLDRFTKDLQSRQAGMPHAAANVRTVLGSVVNVGTRAPASPRLLGPGTRPLLIDKND